MSIHKDCADALRADYRGYGAGKLCAGHAHELVAAFFGYSSGAAMRAEADYPVAALRQADLLVPDLAMMDRRVDEIEGLPSDLLGVDALAQRLTRHLQASGLFRGKVWWTRDLEDHIRTELGQAYAHYTNELSGPMADTNAYYDEIEIDESDLDVRQDGVIANVSGTLSGTTNPDRAYTGDTIRFETVLTLKLVAGRVAYTGPDLETEGSVVHDDIYGDDDG